MAYIGIQPAESFTSFATQTFSVSATTSYTLDNAVANENELALFVNNVRQQPGSGKAYTASSTTLTLSAATATTDTMYCIYLGRALQTVVPATNSVSSSMLGDTFFTGATDVGGALADADLFLIDDGAGGTLRKTAASRIKTYVGGGITEADGYRLTANLSSDADPISSNLERIDDGTFEKIGTGVTNTSGTFSFASTGLYLVMAQAVMARDSSNDNLIDLQVKTTPDNSTYTTRAVIRQSVASDPSTQTGFTQTFVNVDNTSNVKVRFSYSSSGSNALIGDTDSTRTGWWFIRLGDSQ
jgi:hypothetical protein